MWNSLDNKKIDRLDPGSNYMANSFAQNGGFSITVSNSRVSSCKVAVGWINGITYTDSDGNSVSINSEDSLISVSETDSLGVAYFTERKDEWIIDDYTGYYKNTETGPVKLYAPIQTYGGYQDSGYDPVPMYSNFSMRDVNPITTVFTSSIPNRNLQDISTESLMETVKHLEEWTDRKFTQGEIETITTGRVDPSVYKEIIEPIKKSKALFKSLDIEDSEIEIKIENSNLKNTEIKMSKSSYTVAELSGFYKFNIYSKDRKNGGSSSNRISYTTNSNSNGYTSLEKVSQLLGYTVKIDKPITSIITKLYEENSDETTFTTIKNENLADFIKDGDITPTPKESVVFINSVNPVSGECIIFSTDLIQEVGGNKTCNVYVKTPEGTTKEFTNITLSVSSEDQVNNKYLYSVNLYTSSGFNTVPLSGTEFQVEVLTTNNRNQKTSSVVLKYGDGKNPNMYDTILGSLVPIIEGKGDPIDPQETDLVISSKKTKEESPLYLQNGLIGGYKYYKSTLDGDEYYIYWNGLEYVIDNDTDPKLVLAFGSSNPDTPKGSYHIVEKKDKQLLFVISYKNTLS